ncbi:hypothetical protein [Schleiferia thermophila]|jgi:hypothetical protein|uniref:Uncharacterized protein n=1 Tax=Schleiferia thermophila TaxID=884107 RepID=A0A369A754_9FLAO|nr:hypothetical protein [Schleiferia thermophila]KFD39584.1 hypothetical protein AT05_04585 [Schleiferia thermophila str. Yellowstone]RCX04983.1 hypothetical protein DES35_101262 [Schleiferia thermophila]GCD79499.1 hypothetical protein JCM30197_07460 [Schleiferia thermophila]
MIKLFKYRITVLYTFISLSLFGQIKTYSDTNAIFIGQPLNLFFEIEKGVYVQQVQPHDTLNGFFILSEFDTISQDNNSITLALTVTKFDTGFFEFPQLIFLKNSDTLLSSTIGVFVLIPTLNEQIEIYDVKENISFYDDSWIIFLLLAILLIIIIYILYKKLSKRKNKNFQKILQMTLEKETIEKMRNLVKMYEKGDIDGRTFYFESDELIRGYMEKKYGYKFLESTTREMSKYLEKIPISMTNLNLLKKYFKTAELIKFAKVLDDRDNTIFMIQKIIEFMQSQEINDMQINEINEVK